jgi:hypothetical protein
MNKSLDDLLLYAMKVVQEAEANQEKNPSSDFIQVVIVEPFKKPYKKTIKNNLDAMQAIVKGYIEHVTIGETKTGAKITAVINEEGKLNNLPYNRRIFDSKGFVDIFVGTFFITAINLVGENVSLSDEQAEQFIKRFTAMEVYL